MPMEERMYKRTPGERRIPAESTVDRKRRAWHTPFLEARIPRQPAWHRVQVRLIGLPKLATQ